MVPMAQRQWEYELFLRNEKRTVVFRVLDRLFCRAMLHPKMIFQLLNRMDLDYLVLFQFVGPNQKMIPVDEKRVRGRQIPGTALDLRAALYLFHYLGRKSIII